MSRHRVDPSIRRSSPRACTPPALSPLSPRCATEPQAAAHYRPDPRILALADWLGDPVAPADFPSTELRFRNDRWARAVGLDELDRTSDWIAHFGRFEPLPDNLPQPLALRYHGHQFRVYNPEIGDGRGFLSRSCATRDGPPARPRHQGLAARPRGAAPPTGG